MTNMSKEDFTSDTAAVEQLCRSMKISSDAFTMLTLLCFLAFCLLSPREVKPYSYGISVLTIVLVWIAVWRFNMILIGLSNLLEETIEKPDTPSKHQKLILNTMQFVMRTAIPIYRRCAAINICVGVSAVVLTVSGIGVETYIWPAIAIGFCVLNCLVAYSARYQLFLHREKIFNPALG